MLEQHELAFLISEYEAQHVRVQASINSVSQAVALFVGGVTLLATAVTGAAAILFPNQSNLGLGIVSCAFLFTAAGGALTLFATYRARMQQTDSEQSLSRLRRYFLTTWPHLNIYVIGTVHDDWRTPYTHPWSSNTVRGWLSLIGFSSSAFGAGTALAGVALLGLTHPWTVLLGISSGLAAFLSLCAWLWSRLKNKRDGYRPSFPNAGESGLTSP